MRYATPETISFCLVGGRPVFLDSARDRYFTLGEALARAFVAITNGEHPSTDEIDRLIHCGVLAAARPAEGVRPVQIAIPERSLIEGEAAPIQPSLPLAAEIVIASARVAIELRVAGFAAVLERRARRRTPHSACADHGALEQAARAFNAARRLAPLEPVCLRDSLTLIDVLARRGHFPNLVLGVKRNPFAAHCWVQSEEAILNEAVDRATGFTPIRVI